MMSPTMIVGSTQRSQVARLFVAMSEWLAMYRVHHTSPAYLAAPET